MKACQKHKTMFPKNMLGNATKHKFTTSQRQSDFISNKNEHNVTCSSFLDNSKMHYFTTLQVSIYTKHTILGKVRPQSIVHRFNVLNASDGSRLATNLRPVQVRPIWQRTPRIANETPRRFEQTKHLSYRLVIRTIGPVEFDLDSTPHFIRNMIS